MTLSAAAIWINPYLWSEFRINTSPLYTMYSTLLHVRAYCGQSSQYCSMYHKFSDIINSFNAIWIKLMKLWKLLLGCPLEKVWLLLNASKEFLCKMESYIKLLCVHVSLTIFEKSKLIIWMLAQNCILNFIIFVQYLYFVAL